MGFFLVLKAELVRMFIIMRRYWFATAIGIAIGYGMLITIIFAFMANRDTVAAQAGGWADTALNGSLGFVAGIWAFSLVGMFTQGLQGMMRTGELEQLCMSPYGLVTNFLARSFVVAVNSIFSLSVMVWLVSITVGSALYFDPLASVVVFSLTFLNLVGFGFLVGGLVLVFKQTGQVAMIIRLAMLGIATMATTQDINDWPMIPRVLAHALPITDAAICMKYTVADGQQLAVLDENGDKIILEMALATLPSGDPIIDEVTGEQAVVPVYETVFQSVYLHESFWYLLVSCVIWTFLGITVFRYMENWSRSKGTLGAY